MSSVPGLDGFSDGLFAWTRRLAVLLVCACLPTAHAELSVSVGRQHTMIVSADGTLLAVGGNGEGQLGDPTISVRASRPIRITGGAKSVATGGWHTLVVMADGTLWGVGNNFSGQLGDGTKTTRRTPVTIATGVVAAATPSFGETFSELPHTMFLKSDGTLWGVGANFAGQLGDGSKVDRTTPVQVAAGVTSVAAAPGYTLFIRSDHTLWLIGRARDEGNVTVNRTQPVQIASEVVEASGSRGIALMIKSDGTLWRFGNVMDSSIGAVVPLGAPTQIATDVVSASPAPGYLMYVKRDGTLWGMGRNSQGQIGDGTTEMRGQAVQVASEVRSVSAGDSGSVCVKTDGSVWAVGRNDGGQLGDGTTIKRTTFGEVPLTAGLPFMDGDPDSQVVRPRQRVTLRAQAKGDGPIFYQWMKDGVNLPGATAAVYVVPEVAHEHGGTYTVLVTNPLGTLLSAPADVLVATPVQDVKAVAASNYRTYFVLSDGSLWATGENEFGQLGDGSGDSRFTPVKVASGVASVSADRDHTVFVKEDGTLWGMGANFYGGPSDGADEPRRVPTQLAMGVAQASAGRAHAMFVTTNGTLFGMGYDDSGQLGLGSFGGSTPVRLPVEIAQGVNSVSAGWSHTVFIKADGTLWFMGADPGLHDLGPVAEPMQIAADVIAASAGDGYTLFVKKDETLWGVGSRLRIELNLESQPKGPMQLATGVRSPIATKGNGHALFLKTDGTLWGMGAYSNMRRFAKFDPFPLPMQIYLGYEEVVSFAVSSGHLAFIRKDGSLWAAGWNPYGQLGLGSASDTQLPRRVMHGEDMPVFERQPASAERPNGGALTLSASVRDAPSLRLQWERNGMKLAGKNAATFSVASLQPADAGLYTLLAGNEFGDIMSDAAIVGLASTEKLVGAGKEVLSNQYVEQNHNTFDQVLITGAAVAIKADYSADPGMNQITRTSFLDPDGDIVQVEFSGPGTLSLVLGEVSGPAAPSKYNQAVGYMSGRAGIVITGANELSHVSVFSVGRVTAANQALFKSDVDYGGIADLAFVAIASTDGKFGSVRTANTHYSTTRGITGVYAPRVAFRGPVYVGDISASIAATPMIVLGSSNDVRVTGGDLLQPNGRAVQVHGIAQLKFTGGSDSHGRMLAAKANRAVLEDEGNEVTAQIVVNP